MTIRSTLLALAFAVLALPLQAAGLVEGTDYRTLDPPQHSEGNGKIEVVEFFSWGCPHCREFYPLLSAWAAKLPQDVVLKKIACGMGRTAWTNLAKAYYALEATGDVARLDGKIFQAIHDDHLSLFDEKSIADWVAQHGVDHAKFVTTFDSFGVNTRLNQAEQMVENYKIEGVPTLAVGGKYVAIGNSFEQLLASTDALIAKVRAERAAASHK